jgi:hypothetical protein
VLDARLLDEARHLYREAFGAVRLPRWKPSARDPAIPAFRASLANGVTGQ